MDKIKEICSKYNLGKYISSEKITTGLTNILYKVKTDIDTYVIKIINENNIKNKNNHLNNIEYSEEISNILNNNGVNTIGALRFNNKYIQKIDDVYFLIYKWSNGIVLKTCELNIKHMEILGTMLAKIHSIKVDKIDNTKYPKIDFMYYYNLVKDNNEKCYLFFKNNINKLAKIYEDVYNNYLLLGNQKSYVHKDFNRKNILWEDDTPYIIDFETATIGNPSIDFFNSAWFLTDDFDTKKFTSFANTYFNTMNLDDDFEISISAAIIEECNWLEYSLKRALKMNTDNSYEIELGKNSIESSLNEIINYYEKKDLALNILNERVRKCQKKH